MALPPKFTDIIQGWLRPLRKRILWVVLAVIFLIGGAYVLSRTYQFHSTIKQTRADTTNIPNAQRRSGKCEVLFFNVDWCKHCTKAKPEWTAFVSEYNGQTVNGCAIECVGGNEGVNCTKTNDPSVQDAIQHYNIEHYPTLKMKRDGTVYDYDGPITKDNLVKFVTTM
jgi:thiol-disulfide isomerase/thioredoxin